MKMYSLMLFVLCLNISAFLLNESGAFPTSQPLNLSPESIMATFSWNNLLIALATGGVAGVIVGVLTGQSIYALGALIVWAIGSMTPIIREFIWGLPTMLNALLPSELWFISIAIQAVFAIVFFMFIIEVVSQRQIT